MIFIPRPEFWVIGDQSKFSARCEDAVKLTQGLVLDHTTLVVPGLRPGVGEIEVYDPGDSIRAPESSELGGIRMKHSNIRHLVAANTIRGVTKELACPFDAQEVGVRLENRLLHEKGALAGTDLEFEGIVRSFKPAPGIEGPIPRWRKLIGGDSECTELEVFSA